MEVEAKFAVPNRRTYDQLARLDTLAGYSLAPTGVARVADRYFDTTDGRLLAAGYACRLRAEGNAVIATLKGLSGAEDAVHRRVEEEARLVEWNPDPTAWPESGARTLALELMGSAALESLFDLRQRRVRANVLDGERRVAQLSLDHVRVDPSSSSGQALTGLRSAYYELEIELTPDGAEADLAKITGELQATWNLAPEPRSKFERALALAQAQRAEAALFAAARPAPEVYVSGANPELAPQAAAPALTPTPAQPPISPVLADEPMSEAGRKVLYLHFTRMLVNEPGTRLGEDPEALHDMRVATRRMRAAFQLFSPYFDAKALKPFGKGLRRTGRILGAVRDLDVLLDKAWAYVAGLPPDQADVLGPLLTVWQTHREVARRRMLEYLDGGAYRKFKVAFERFLTTPGAGALPVPAGQPSSCQVRHIVSQLIFTRYDSVRAYELIVAGASLDTLHQLRIECKGLRYALEFFRDVLGPETPGLIKQVVAMQDLLGELQDARVAEGLITEFLAQEHSKRKKKQPEAPLAGVEAYLVAQRTRQDELLARFPDAWAELIGYDFRKNLGLAVAAL